MKQRFVGQESSRVRVETRADGKRVLSGYGIVFYDATDPGTEYKMWGDWFERISDGAVDETLANKERDVTATFNHNRDLILGRLASGTLKLTKDAVGVKYEIELPDTTVAKDVATLVDRGDIRGSSFTFVERAFAQDSTDEKHKTWTVTALDLYEIGPVTEPAYKATTTELRMDEDRLAKIQEIENQERALRVSAIKASIKAKTLD